MNEELQVENGHFTRIVNPLLENLIKVPFKGCELSIAIFIIRKTYGFNKIEDEISISQIMKGVNRSRQTVVTALKNLQLVNILRLVKKGNAKGVSNTWIINKYYSTWKVVNTVRLVKRNDKPSLMEDSNLVKTGRHTKETTKETKDIYGGLSPRDVSLFINSFKGVNPSYDRLFGNTTEIKCSVRLIKRYSLEKMIATAENLVDIISKPYAPRITTPYELERNLGKLIAFVEQNKNLIKNKKTKVAFV